MGQCKSQLEVSQFNENWFRLMMECLVRNFRNSRRAQGTEGENGKEEEEEDPSTGLLRRLIKKAANLLRSLAALR